MDLERKLPDEWPVFSAGAPERDIGFCCQPRPEIKPPDILKHLFDNNVVYETDFFSRRLGQTSQRRQKFRKGCKVKDITLADVRAWELDIVRVEHANSTKLVLEW